MKIVIEDWNEQCPIGINEFKQFTIKIEGRDVHFQMMDCWFESKPANNFYEIPRKYYKLVAESIQKLTVKTKEEIAAEESVAKAEEALKAAKNALKAVKEEK